ncbi:hypothetical protein GCM10007989_25330 [Devosia pacifica]|uniref:Uncharacterized protein n=1 Tax=Devosia pacifica TaxID=1335967 RepID=A0A918VVZ2_9HYPH|nr:hypothetical protein [Devosia pacifica]GHA28225.1 hypothetical protein GCM10007989_25330 [Devosia pacifica]
MSDTPHQNRRGRILIVVLGVIALIFIGASIITNLSAWQRADERAAAGETLPETAPD